MLISFKTLLIHRALHSTISYTTFKRKREKKVSFYSFSLSSTFACLFMTRENKRKEREEIKEGTISASALTLSLGQDLL